MKIIGFLKQNHGFSLKAIKNDYSTIMKIMGALNKANFTNISLVTESGGALKM